MESFRVSPIPFRLREPLRAALRGEVSAWPSDLDEAEGKALVEHGVAPLVYAVQQLPVLRGEAIRAGAVEAARAEDLQDVLAGLAASGVGALILKGTALAYDIYSAPEQRPRGDVDLLVARGEAGKAMAYFRASGFAERPSSGDEHGVLQTAFSRVGSHGVQHEYDLHWDVANSPIFSSVLQYQDLAARSVALPFLGAHARGLSRVDALLLACIHRVAHHHDSQRLIWLVDIGLLRDRMSRAEHAQFWRRAMEGRVVSVCARSIELADEWMSRPPRFRAEEFLTERELQRHEPSRAFLAPSLTYGGVMAANLGALPWRSRLTRLWQLAFPPAAFVRETFDPAGRAFLPWLYVRRGVRGVRRLFQRML